MTKIIYDESNNVLEISGHAGAGEPGEDLVCAAVTILMRTLEASVMDNRARLCPTVCHKDGYARIQCNPAPRAKAKSKEIFTTIYRGYELLAQQYPEYVRTVIY